ncbi:MAG: chemotaxis protein CheC [Bacteroidales bacterium]
MILTNTQKDNLTELINIGFSRAAAALSELTGDRILLEVPKVNVVPVNELSKRLSPMADGEVTTVHQLFAGEVSGDAMLILNRQGALLLTDLLTESETGTYTDFSSTVKEVLLEVGNIILNSCLGMFGNLLKVHFTFSVPELHINAIEEMLKTLDAGEKRVDYALLVFMGFRCARNLFPETW